MATGTKKVQAVAKVAKTVVQEVGQGVKITTAGDKVTVELDLGNNFGLSASQKSLILGTTHGFVSLGEGVSLNLNLVKSAR